MTVTLSKETHVDQKIPPLAKLKEQAFPLPFWIIWSIEFWERFGFYGMQAILALYMSHAFGYSSNKSILIFGSFSAFCYGFVWIGGVIGDQYLGAKRTIILGAVILMLSYALLSLGQKETFFYALSGIIVGNALFKANPSSLISKLYHHGDHKLDGAMTLYYFAINIGGFISVIFTPTLTYPHAFLLCALGLFLGILIFSFLFKKMEHVSTKADLNKLSYLRLFAVVSGALSAVIIIANLLDHTTLVTSLAFIISSLCFIYFIFKAFQFPPSERNKMLIALVLIIQAIVFFALYQQMPTSLTFFAEHNVNRLFDHHQIPAPYFYDLDPLFIMIMSPILAYVYKKYPTTHVTKFCFGMTLSALSFLILWASHFSTASGIVSPSYLILSYLFQATGELLISALGLAMVASLCPQQMSGFVMGLWFVSFMLAGPIGAWVGNLTQPIATTHLTNIQSLTTYTNAFGEIGLLSLTFACLMWLTRPLLNRYLN